MYFYLELEILIETCFLFFHGTRSFIPFACLHTEEIAMKLLENSIKVQAQHILQIAKNWHKNAKKDGILCRFSHFFAKAIMKLYFRMPLNYT